MQTADQHGVTIFDYKAETKPLLENIHNQDGSAYDLSEYIRVTEEFMARYGIVLDIPSASSQVFRGTNFIDIDGLSPEMQWSVRLTLMNLIEELGVIPVEFIQAINLEKVTLVMIEEERMGGFVNDTRPTEIVIDPTKFVHTGLFAHEIGHMVDGGQGCTSFEAARNDEAYMALNPADMRYVGDNYADASSLPPYTSYESVLGYPHVIPHKMQQYPPAFTNGGSINESWCDRSDGVTVVSDYSFKSPVEDKAELLRYILGVRDFDTIVDPCLPRLRDKSLLIFSRLFESNPRFAEFFIDAANITLVHDP